MSALTPAELEQIKRLPTTEPIDPHEELCCGTFIAQKANTALQEYVEGYFCCECIPCCWKTKKISALPPNPRQTNLYVMTFKSCGYVGKHTNLAIVNEGKDLHLPFGTYMEYDLNTLQFLRLEPQKQKMYDALTDRGDAQSVRSGAPSPTPSE
jgi:hypothetical protein